MAANSPRQSNISSTMSQEIKESNNNSSDTNLPQNKSSFFSFFKRFKFDLFKNINFNLLSQLCESIYLYQRDEYILEIDELLSRAKEKLILKAQEDELNFSKGLVDYPKPPLEYLVGYENLEKLMNDHMNRLNVRTRGLGDRHLSKLVEQIRESSKNKPDSNDKPNLEHNIDNMKELEKSIDLLSDYKPPDNSLHRISFKAWLVDRIFDQQDCLDRLRMILLENKIDIVKTLEFIEETIDETRLCLLEIDIPDTALLLKPRLNYLEINHGISMISEVVKAESSLWELMESKYSHKYLSL